jgi:NAD(P)-dependent dehydrogenase (short-subunit alcohol dehydrogenase family)
MANILITGCSRGIGEAAALHFAGSGNTVYASMRNTSKGDKLRERSVEAGYDIRICEADVTDVDSVNGCVKNILDEVGHIDVLVNNAGIGPLRTVEETDEEESKEIFETNFFGALRTMRAVLPSMRERRSGRIINVSSVAARVPTNCMGIYSASKAALEAASESLAKELVPFGISVSVIEPAFTATEILDAALDSISNETKYAIANERIEAFFNFGKQNAEPVENVVRTIDRAANEPHPKFRYTVSESVDNLLASRAKMSDEDWIAMGRHTTVEDYFQEFAVRFAPAPQEAASEA